jgi:DNA-directed RNA polymerase subunit RPC12/RpoP
MEAGEKVACPQCETEVLHHSMIPLLRAGTKSYVCVACARTFIDVKQPAGRA